ncbi:MULTISPECIES: hypothetical protein [Jannaschia]|uniref:hypothetical protein n=1 Tax=Jannaschia TaxID=188905 RepID=UPI001C7D9909|nr:MULTISPECIES: hypothetical protein [unclassified Jannaschia]
MIRNCVILATTVLCALGLPGVASSAVLVEIEELPTGIYGTVSGSLDTTGLMVFGGIFSGNAIFPDQARILVSPVGGATSGLAFSDEIFDIDDLVFGDGGRAVFVSTGGLFAISKTNQSSFPRGSSVIRLPAAYTSGDEISSAFSITGQSFSDIGIFPNVTRKVTLVNNDTITVRTIAPVPTPGSVLLALSGVAAIVSLKRRRRTRQRA